MSMTAMCTLTDTNQVKN